MNSVSNPLLTQLEKHLPFLDAIRGVAIFVVFLFHCLVAAFPYDQLIWNGFFRNFNAPNSFLFVYPITYGWAGVAIFFTVSGFCIHLSYCARKNWSNFFVKRFFRIYPLYLISILFFFFVWPWGSFSISSGDKIEEILSHISLYQNFSYKYIYGISPSFWSIAVEVQLYLIYPILYFLISKNGIVNALKVSFIAEFTITAFESYYDCVYETKLPCLIVHSAFAYWFSWSIGVYLADSFLNRKINVFSRIRFDIIALLAFLCPLFRPTAPFAFLMFSILTCVAIDRFISKQWVVPDFGNMKYLWNHLSSLGVISYSFYLIHQPFMFLIEKILRRVPFDYMTNDLIVFFIYSLSYPIIFYFSTRSYKYLEKNFIKLGANLNILLKNI